MIDPSLYHGLTENEAALIRKIVDFTQAYFENPRFDASHDFEHVMRVTALAIKILECEQPTRTGASAPLNPFTVILGALLHDVDDSKYRDSSSSAAALVQSHLLNLGLDSSYASRIQALVDGVSYSSEVKHPQRVRDLIITIPELAIVQDADRLDAMGAVGIGRLFAYGAVRTSRGLNENIQHLDVKLLQLEKMMKTTTGRDLARVYTDRLKEFKSWWQEEIGFAGCLP